MNGFPEAVTGDRFEGDDYRFLIVASKFQTGFAQPTLVAMGARKRPGGVACAPSARFPPPACTPLPARS